jgi:quercetin dioxygenase-like cupin family protein
MPVVRATDATVHDLQGARFSSYAAPSRGTAGELCAWRLDLPPGSDGVPHTVSREEVFLVLSGTLYVTLTGPGNRGDGAATTEGRQGDVFVVPAGATLRVGTPDAEAAAAWVTTSAGLKATMADGSTLAPPWAQ